MEEWRTELYRLVAKQPRYARRLAEAEMAIHRAVETCRTPAVSFSFGKDSLVCLDIARRIEPDILVINIDRGAGGDLQEIVDLYEAYAAQHGLNYHRVRTPREILEIYREAGTIANVTRENLKANLMAGIRTAKETFGIDCQIMGLRAEESRGRGYLRQYGTFHYSEEQKTWLCKPVLHWQGDEIWAYIVSNEVPYARWYDLEAIFCGYERARYSNWAGVFGREQGRFVRLRKNYPQEYALLASVVPDIGLNV